MLRYSYVSLSTPSGLRIQTRVNGSADLSAVP
jgi:hypothetical protein